MACDVEHVAGNHLGLTVYLRGDTSKQHNLMASLPPAASEAPPPANPAPPNSTTTTAGCAASGCSPLFPLSSRLLDRDGELGTVKVTAFLELNPEEPVNNPKQPVN